MSQNRNWVNTQKPETCAARDLHYLTKKRKMKPSLNLNFRLPAIHLVYQLPFVKKEERLIVLNVHL